MKYSFAIGIPTLNRADLLNPTLHQYFSQFPDVEIFIVNNGPQSIVRRDNHFTLHEPEENYGVAKSWNYLCDQIFQDHDYALILNDDIRLNLDQDAIENFLINQDFDLFRCQPHFHFCCFALSKNYFLKERFDEAFYPAYCEDRDYLYRLELNKGKVLEHSFLNPHQFINSATISPNGGDPNINKNFDKLRTLYIQKWGGPIGEEKFLTPFQDLSPQVTFITPSLNRPTLPRAIQSLYNQTDTRWKSIIIYDNVDATLAFDAKKIKTLNTDSKLGVITNNKQPHNQAGLVRNAGLEKVDTKWTAFLDDDDTLTPNYVELLLSKYSEFDLVIFKMHCTKNNLIIPRHWLPAIRFANVGISFAFKTPKEPILFDRNDGGEDFEFVKKLVERGYKYTVTEEVCYHVAY